MYRQAGNFGVNTVGLTRGMVHVHGGMLCGRRCGWDLKVGEYLSILRRKSASKKT